MKTHRWVAFCSSVIFSALIIFGKDPLACSNVIYLGENPETCSKIQLIGRTLDWAEGVQDTGFQVYTFPKNLDRVGSTQGNPFKWTSQYTSLVSYIYDGMAIEGVNDQGLVGRILFLKESDYGESLASQSELATSLWLQYILDSFPTVAEAAQKLGDPPFHLALVEAGKNFKALSTVHLALTDATGDCAVIEYIQGQPKVYRSAHFKVMTNSPSFDEQLKNLLSFVLLGEEGLPGETDSPSRFIRAAHYLARLSQKVTGQEARAGLMSVMRNISEPYVEATSTSPEIAPTVWVSLLDQSESKYYVDRTDRLCPVFMDLKKLDFTQVTSVSLAASPQEEERRDISAFFSPAQLPPFVQETVS